MESRVKVLQHLFEAHYNWTMKIAVCNMNNAPISHSIGHKYIFIFCQSQNFQVQKTKFFQTEKKLNWISTKSNGLIAKKWPSIFLADLVLLENIWVGTKK